MVQMFFYKVAEDVIETDSVYKYNFSMTKVVQMAAFEMLYSRFLTSKLCDDFFKKSNI